AQSIQQVRFPDLVFSDNDGVRADSHIQMSEVPEVHDLNAADLHGLRLPSLLCYTNHGVRSKTRCSWNGSRWRRNAAVKYAMSPAYFVVIGSAVKESVEAQLSFV